jgi:hypothetical protein
MPWSDPLRLIPADCRRPAAVEIRHRATNVTGVDGEHCVSAFIGAMGHSHVFV